MSDAVIIDEGHLAQALTGFRLTVRAECTAGAMGTSPASGTVAYPDEAAASLFGDLASEFRKRLSGPPVILPQPPEADNEIAALTVIVDRLEHLQPPAVQRVIRYLRDRYGTDG